MPTRQTGSPTRKTLPDPSGGSDGDVVSRNAAGTDYELTTPSGGGVLNNFSATADPVVTDDTSEGYSVGSRWVNVTDDTAWTCVDATERAAVWVQGSGA